MLCEMLPMSGVTCGFWLGRVHSRVLGGGSENGRESSSWIEIIVKYSFGQAWMCAIVLPHVNVAVRRSAHVAGEMVAEAREGLPAVLAGGPRRRRHAGGILADQETLAALSR
jgi:hypothetical protein